MEIVLSAILGLHLVVATFLVVGKDIADRSYIKQLRAGASRLLASQL